MVERDRLLVEKVLTAVYSKLCDNCKKNLHLREIRIELGIDNADTMTMTMGINL